MYLLKPEILPTWLPASSWQQQAQGSAPASHAGLGWDVQALALLGLGVRMLGEGGICGVRGLGASVRLRAPPVGCGVVLVGWHWTGPEQGPVPTARAAMPALPVPMAGAVDAAPGDGARWHRDSRALSPAPTWWHNKPSPGPQAS